MQTEDLGFTFLAELPGIHAQRLSGDLRTGRFSAVLYLPQSWHWNTGASPGKSVELYVVAGKIMLGDLALEPGNHAYLPPGSTGMSIATTQGAQILYFLDDAASDAVIQTPLFMSRDVVAWRPSAEGQGFEEKELRADPGSGARTWLLKVEPGAEVPWQKTRAVTEGFLLSGDYRQSECVNGEPVTGDYTPGGYFRHPPGAVSGGPEAGTVTGAVWLMRSAGRDAPEAVDGCHAPAAPPAPAAPQ